MKLIIKEYISLLKESKELDSLIPELLLAMGHEILSKPKIGHRQFGVDVASKGIDENGKEKIFLFTIKQGDIIRKDWNSNEQSVRPSLDEILDVYISNKLLNIYSNLPKKIILATGGDMEQNVEENWKGYTERHKKANEIEFDFWGGDKLSLLIEKYMFDEYIFPKELRSKFRKTLALLDDNDYDLSDYFELINALLFENLLETKTKKRDKEILKTLNLIYLSLNIIYSWSKSNNNIKHSLIASERVVLNLYFFLYKTNFLNKRNLMNIFMKTLNFYFKIIQEYSKKIYPHIEIENGLALKGYDFFQESLILFEQLGIVSTFGNIYYFFTNEAFEYENFDYEEYVNINNHIKLMIKNHKGLLNPVYDEHIIDISLAIHLLELFEEKEFIEEWIMQMINHIRFALIQSKYFPIDTNDFDDLVELNIYKDIDKKEFLKTSTLIPILAFWCIKLNLEEAYKFINETIKEFYNETTLQIWFPDEDLENFVYKENAALQSGYVFAPINLRENINEMKELINKIKEKGHFVELKNKKIPILYLISSRHFRMPILLHFVVDEIF